MFVFANLIQAIAVVIDNVLWFYMLIIIARAILSWVSPDPYNPIVRLLYNVTEPVLWRIRRALPLRGAGIDFSPIIVFLIILFLQHFLVRSLYDLAQTLRYSS